jgi:uncharacterized protein (DUF2141 family)
MLSFMQTFTCTPFLRRPLSAALLALLLLLSSAAAWAQPVVSSFSPTSGATGSTVVISGSGFTGATSVRFGELSAVFTVNSSTQITATVPRAASTQRLNVTTSAGYDLSSTDFAVTRGNSLSYSLVADNFAGVSGGANAAPAVADLDGDGRLDLLVGLADGTISRYEQNTVNGTAFTALGSLRDGSNAIIDIGTQSTVAIVDLDGDGRLSLMLGRGDGTVSEYEQTSVGASTFTLAQNNVGGISTPANTVPCMTDLNGDGRLDIITGKGDGIISHFQQSTSNGSSFSFIDSNFNNIQLSGNAATFFVDLDGNGALDLLVGVDGGTIYRYQQNAAHSFSVNQQSNSFNGISAGSNAKPCVTDIDGDGLLDLLVGRGDGTISRYEQAGTVPAPSISSFTPTSGPVGTTVTVTGTNLAGVSAVRVNGTAGTLTGTPTATSFTFTVGIGSGTGSISVNTPGGSASSTGNFTVTVPNTAPTDISLSNASVAENQPLNTPVGTFSTTDAQGGTFAYTFAVGGADNGSFNILSGTTLTTNGSFDFETKSSYSIKIRSTDAGGLFFEKTFTIAVNDVNETPTITNFTPTSGLVGTSGIVITGTNFSSAGAATVKFNGTTATTATVNSNTQITATVPSGATTGRITVQNADGTGTSTSDFTVTAPVTLATVTTAAPGSVTSSSAVLGGNVTSAGGGTVTERGVVYVAGSGTPTTSNSKVIIGSGPGTFSQTVSGLPGNTLYSVRAYAINGAGTAYGNTQTFTTANNPPTAVDDSYTVNEDSSPTPFTVLANDTDPDAGNALIVTGVTQPAGGIVTFTGTGVSFTPNLNFSGTTTFTYGIADGDGGTDTGTVTVTVTGVNDAPVVTVPATQTTNEDVPFAFSSGNGNAITIGDVDAGSGQVEIYLGATQGAVSLSTTAGLTFTAGDGTADASMTFRGTLTSINAALNNLTFAPNAGYNGAAALQVQANDLGNTGSGGAKSDSKTVAINVTAVNDAPVLTASSGSTAYTAFGNAVAVDGGLTATDSDNATLASGTVSIITNFQNGTDVLAFSNTSSATFGNIAGSYAAGTGVLTLTSSGRTATVAQWQAALRAVTYGNSGTPTGTSRVVSFRVNDGTTNSNTVTKNTTITVPPAPNTTIVSGPPTIGNSSTVNFVFSSDQSPVVYATSGAPNATFSNNGPNSSFGPIPDGTYTLSVAARNTNTNLTDPTPATYTFTVDTQRPTPVITSSAGPSGGSTPTAPIPFVITFPENVTGFDVPDVTVTGGTFTANAVSGTVYNISVTPTGPGSVVTVSVAANGATDAAGNQNTASNTYSLTYAPAPVITSLSPSNGPVGATVVITGSNFTGATAVRFNGLDASSYVVNSSTQITAVVAPGTTSGSATVVTAAGTSNGPIFSITIASTSTTLASSANPSTAGQSVTFTATVTNTNGSATPAGTVSFRDGGTILGSGTLDGSGVATFSTSTLTQGSHSILAIYLGRTGFSSSTSATLSQVVNPPAPVVTSVAGPANGTYRIGQFVTFLVSFDQPVTVSTAGGTPVMILTIGSTPRGVAYFSGSNTNTLTFRYLVQAGDLDTNGVTLGGSIAANNGTLRNATGTDAVLALNNVAALTGVLVDGVVPTATVTTTATNPSSTSLLPITITFSEPVTGLTAAGITVSNGTKGTLSGSGTTYTLNVTATANGPVTVQVSAGAAQDAAGNPNPASSTLSVTYTPPPVAISSFTPTSGAAGTVVVITGTGFNGATSVTINNGAVASYTVDSNTQITATVATANTTGLIRVVAPAGTGTSSTNFVVGPAVTAVTATANGTYKAGQTISFFVAFSQNVTVTGTPTLGLTVGSAARTLTYAGGSGTNTLTFSYVIVAGDLDLDGVQLSTGSIAPNGGTLRNSGGADADPDLDNVAATTGLRVDAVAPTVAIGSTATSPTSTAPIPVTVTFSESVTGFAATDVAVTNGSLTGGSFGGSGSTYSFTITPTASGTVTVNIAANAAQDAATNGNVAAPAFSISYAPTVPTVTSLSADAELPGMPVVITGTGFTSGSTVSFGGTPATGVTFTSATSLTAVVPANAPAGSSVITVTTGGQSSASAPAFAVLKVYDAVANCLSTVPYVATGDGAWHYLLAPNGQVVAALQDTRAALGSVSLDFLVAGTAGAVRLDGRGHKYLDRNWHLTASNGTFTGSSVSVRFYGLVSEFTRLQATDASVSYAALKTTQYSGPNEDCALSNNGPGESRVLPLAASTPGNGVAWFVAEASVPDHFSEFYLTGSSVPLPVELSTFTAEAKGGAVRLDWTTASEKNSARFEVERSLNGRSFERIGTVAAAGSSSAPLSYTFPDTNLPTPQSTIYYRLRQVDLDGTASYSPVRNVAVGGPAALALFPNPAHGGATTLTGAAPGTLVQVLDATGRVVLAATANDAGQAGLLLPSGTPSGVYVVRAGSHTLRLMVE